MFLACSSFLLCLCSRTWRFARRLPDYACQLPIREFHAAHPSLSLPNGTPTWEATPEMPGSVSESVGKVASERCHCPRRSALQRFRLVQERSKDKPAHA